MLCDSLFSLQASDVLGISIFAVVDGREVMSKFAWLREVEIVIRAVDLVGRAWQGRTFRCACRQVDKRYRMLPFLKGISMLSKFVTIW
jgi:hypothetical protein